MIENKCASLKKLYAENVEELLNYKSLELTDVKSAFNVETISLSIELKLFSLEGMQTAS